MAIVLIEGEELRQLIAEAVATGIQKGLAEATAAPQKTLSTAEVAEILGFAKTNTTSVHLLVAEGRLPAMRIGKGYRFDPASVKRYCEESNVAGGHSRQQEGGRG